MKLIFLDCDGVVNSHGTFVSHKHDTNLDKWPIDPKLLANVQRIVEATGAKIVLSSDWKRRVTSYAVIKRACKPWGEVIDKTPHLSGRPRHEEISRWIDLSLFPAGRPEMYAVIDDTAHAGGDHPFFQTTMRHGLTEAIADEVIAHLGRE